MVHFIPLAVCLQHDIIKQNGSYRNMMILSWGEYDHVMALQPMKSHLSSIMQYILVFMHSIWWFLRNNIKADNRLPYPPWKSQIVPSYRSMHYIVFGVNFQIPFVSLVSLVSIHLLIHLSTHLYHHSHSHHPSLLHYFTSSNTHCRIVMFRNVTIYTYTHSCLLEFKLKRNAK